MNKEVLRRIGCIMKKEGSKNLTHTWHVTDKRSKGRQWIIGLKKNVHRRNLYVEDEILGISKRGHEKESVTESSKMTGRCGAP